MAPGKYCPREMHADGEDGCSPIPESVGGGVAVSETCEETQLDRLGKERPNVPLLSKRLLDSIASNPM